MIRSNLTADSVFPSTVSTRGLDMLLKGPLIKVAMIVGVLVANPFMVAVAHTYAPLDGDDAVLIQAEHVITGEGELLEPGAILVRNGKIEGIGKEVIAEGAKVVQAKWVMPGLVNAASDLGLAGGTSEVSAEVTPDFDTSSTMDWSSRAFSRAVDEGITTSHVVPGTQSVFAGVSCLVKTAGNPSDSNVPYLMKKESGLTIALCTDPTGRNQSRGRPDTVFMRQPTNRMGVVWILRSLFQKALEAKTTDELDEKKMAILRKALDQSLPLYSVSRTEVDIQSCFTLQNEFGVQPIIIGGDEAYRLIDTITERKPKIIFTGLTTSSRVSGLRGEEGTARRWNVLGQLDAAGATYCLAGDQLLEQARFAHRFGLSRDAALRSITLNPASILKIDSDVGSLRQGKSADLLALDADPLEFRAAVQWVMVEGKVLSQP
ncbi:amidohydrolase family protein [Pirellulaceae bacterium SH467]